MKPQESNHWFSFCTPTEFQSTREVPTEREIFYECMATHRSECTSDQLTSFFLMRAPTQVSFAYT